MSDTGLDEELVRTKLVAPTLPGPFVMRSRLHEAIESALSRGHRLVLVSSPAGTGKSTLLAGWAAERSGRVAWLQVESSDADPARFWSYVLASLGIVEPDIESAVRPLVASSGDDASAVVAALANSLTGLGEPLVLVIDDYHLIDNGRVHRGVERLVELCPANVTIVIGTRVDPPFRLGRLRVRDQLTELRSDELRFDQGEAPPLLGARPGEVSEQVIGELVERTEGWAAGLVLAGISIRSVDDAEGFLAGFGGGDRLIVDYLSDELLAAMSDDDRQRLLQTSVLERLTGALVDAVTGTQGGGAWLRETAATNQLVIGLDRSGTWYRYHHLLRDLLRLEAEARLGDQLPELHLAAARWHHQQGSLHDAVEHHLSAGDLQTAADLIARNASVLLNGGQLQTVRRQIDRLGEFAEQHVGALVVRGWIAFSTGEINEAQRLLEQAHLLDVEGNEEGLIVALGIMTSVARGDIGTALAAAELAIEPSEATQAMTLGGVRVWAGRFDAARPFLELAQEMAMGTPHDFVAVVNPGLMAVMEIESANPAGATRHANTAISLAEERSMSEAPQMALPHSIIARTSTNHAGAAASARRAVELARRSPEYIVLAYALASAGDVLSAQDDPEGALLLAEARLIIDRCPDPGVAAVYLAKAEARHGAEILAPRSPLLVEGLTDREYAVLRLLQSELSQRDIASELYIALNTVKTHCRAIYRKLAVTDRKAAVQAARDLDLL